MFNDSKIISNAAGTVGVQIRPYNRYGVEGVTATLLVRDSASDIWQNATRVEPSGYVGRCEVDHYDEAHAIEEIRDAARYYGVDDLALVEGD